MALVMLVCENLDGLKVFVDETTEIAITELARQNGTTPEAFLEQIAEECGEEILEDEDDLIEHLRTFRRG